jgi:ribonuclease T1
MNRSSSGRNLGQIVLLVVSVLLLAGCAITPVPASTVRTTSPSATPQVKATATPRDGLETIREQDLPKEGRVTLRLIRAGGPFPFAKDGSVFQNREGLLPKKPRGYYREYTVITPGENDRGARRIVAGENGEQYYTEDHYNSFKRVTP